MPETKVNDKISIAFIHAHNVRILKKGDYGSIADYFPFGAKSFCHELHKKTKRLVNLAKKKTNIPQNESLEDNLLDLINYASYYYEWLKGELNE